MKPEAIRALTVRQLRERVVAGELDHTAGAIACFDAVGTGDDAVNAFVHLAIDAAIAAARDLDARAAIGLGGGSLAGVPVAVSDNIDVAGMPCANGLGALAERMPRHDAGAVAALRDAGAVIPGKTNLHEGSLGFTTDNPHFGRTHHPLRKGYSPGGAAGGAAAAVAAGFCQAGLATDTLGSVLLPASCCGVVGMSPTRGRVSRVGVVPLSPTLDSIGVFGRCVDDVTALVAALAGYDGEDEQSAHAPAGDRIEPGPDTGLPPRLLYLDVRGRVDDAIEEALAQALDALRHIGIPVEALRVEESELARVRRAALMVCEAEAYVAHRQLLVRSGVSATFRALLEFGAGKPSDRIEEARAELRTARRFWREAVGDGAILLPAATQRAFDFDAPVPEDLADYAIPAGVAGLPAIVVPMDTGEDAWPVGVQLLGPAFGETRLAALARRLESALAPR